MSMSFVKWEGVILEYPTQVELRSSNCSPKWREDTEYIGEQKKIPVLLSEEPPKAISAPNISMPL
jgi:hypothetical protein